MYNKLSLMIFVLASVNHIQAMEQSAEAIAQHVQADFVSVITDPNTGQVYPHVQATLEHMTQRDPGMEYRMPTIFAILNELSNSQATVNQTPNDKVDNSQKKEVVSKSSARCAYPSF